MGLTQTRFFFYIVLFPCVVASVFVYFIINLSHRMNLYDDLGGRKIHSGNIPRLGGIGFLSAFIIVIIFLQLKVDFLSLLPRVFIYPIIGGFLIFIMGVWDDLKNLNANVKLIVQCIAAFIVVYADLCFKRIYFDPLSINLELGLLGSVITFFWIIGIINAVNLMDGIDGQVGLLSISLLISYGIIAVNEHMPLPILYSCIILISAICGFLFFNLSYPSAKIFMGDCGSQTLGFILAVFPLLPKDNNYALVSLPFALLFLILPIFDTFAAIWRRLRDKKSIREGDQFHLHHKLMLMGLTPREALIVFASFQICITFMTTTSVLLQGYMALLTSIVLVVVCVLFFTVLHNHKDRTIKETNRTQ